ncbi:hypothetical protein Tco_0808103 [Tanacetum coccineum]
MKTIWQCHTGKLWVIVKGPDHRDLASERNLYWEVRKLANSRKHLITKARSVSLSWIFPLNRPQFLRIEVGVLLRAQYALCF